MKKFQEVSKIKMLYDGVKIFAFLGFVMVALSLVGCTSTVETTPEEPEKKVEQPVEEEVKEPEKKVEQPVEELDKVKSDDVQAAYEYLKPAVEEMSAGLDHDYQVIDGAIYLTGYISEDELYMAIERDTWKNNVEDLQKSTKIISENLRDAGYDTYKIKFNFSYCDKVDRQNTAYLVVRDGRVVYDTADEHDLYKEQ